MKQKLYGLMLFALGGGVGFAAGTLLLRKKYERLSQEEIDSVKAAFRRERKAVQKTDKKDEDTHSQTTVEAPAPPEIVAQTQKLAVDLGYAEKKSLPPRQVPRVISPDEYGEKDGYDEISLTYYADGTLADDADRAMDETEINQSVGMESLDHFGEYEDDSVFVRNDRLKVDYEILLDQRTYAEVLKEKPYLAR